LSDRIGTNARSRRHAITAIEESPKLAVSLAELRAPHRRRTERPDRCSVSTAAVLTVFRSRARRLYVAASLGHLLEVIAAWKLTKEANRVRFELKYHNGE
jgi:hypothetical protein